MKVLFITDSLGLPRDKPELVNYDQAWTNMFDSNLRVHKCSLGGGIIKDFTEQIVYLKRFDPDIVFLQLGIVDCAPRALTMLENRFINHFRITSKMAEKFLPKYTPILRKRRQISYTSPPMFKNYLEYIQNSFNCKVYSIGIVPPSDSYEEHIYGVKKKVTLYNTILQDVFKTEFIDISDIKGNMVMSDNIHLNTIGHKFLFNKVNEIIKKTI